MKFSTWDIIAMLKVLHFRALWISDFSAICSARTGVISHLLGGSRVQRCPRLCVKAGVQTLASVSPEQSSHRLLWGPQKHQRHSSVTGTFTWGRAELNRARWTSVMLLPWVLCVLCLNEWGECDVRDEACKKLRPLCHPGGEERLPPREGLQEGASSESVTLQEETDDSRI